MGSDWVMRVKPLGMGLVSYKRDLKSESKEKTVIYEPGSGLSPDPKSVGTLIFNFPAYRTLKITVYCLSVTQSVVFYYKSLNGLSTSTP